MVRGAEEQKGAATHQIWMAFRLNSLRLSSGSFKVENAVYLPTPADRVCDDDTTK